MAVGGRVLVAGFGDVGQRLARRLQARGDEVLAIRRRDAAIPGARLFRADLATGEGLARLPREVEAVVFCAAPDQRDEAAYRALYHDGLRRLLDAVSAPRVLFVSSTAVYGQDDGGWVDENSPTEPPAFNGRVLREAEQVLDAHAGGTVLRLSGIYGPGREALLRKARAGEPGSGRWTNRIHVEDAAAALAHLLALPSPLALYLGSDDRPAPEAEVLAWLRAQEALPPVPSSTGKSTGRRVANQRLRASGWAPAFEDFRKGYATLVAIR